MPIKIGHMADLHLGERKLNRIDDFGRNMREIDFERAALAAADKMISEKPDFVVVAGDALHDTHVSGTSLNGAIIFAEKFKQAGIRLIVIGGNHDELETADRFNMLHILKHHGVELFLNQSHLDIEGLRLHLVSFRVLSRALHGSGALKPLDIAPDMPNVLVAHGYATGPGNTSPPEEVEIPKEWLDDPRLDLILLGHIHHQTEVRDRVFYSGSTERRGFGERNEDPGFLIHDVGADGVRTSSFLVKDLGIENTPRPMKQIEVDAAKLTIDELDAKVRKILVDDVKDTIVRLVISDVSGEYDRSKIRSVWNKIFQEANGFHLDVVTQTQRVAELMDIKFTSPPVDLKEAFHEYLSAQKIDGADRLATLELGSEIIAVAHEKILAQETD